MRKSEGKMKGILKVKSNVGQFSSVEKKSYREPIIYSMKYGFVTFMILLVSLRILGVAIAVIDNKPIVLFDGIDLAISLLGFLLMFSGKLLESVYGRD